MDKLKANKLRKSSPNPSDLKKIKRNPIYFILDEVIDTYNIGSLFRLADAVGVEKMYLCGNMEFPPSSRVHKAAVGTENWVPWEKRDSTLEVIKELKEKSLPAGRQGVQILAVEQSKNSISYKDLKPNFPVALVLGNETRGISEEILQKVDLSVELPMMGINNSFNVWGTAAVVAYKLLEFLFI
ncbi:MAG: hypothetical protein HY044_00390 [Candidatus Woesebacteria bacterium]|nr:MAG: hypothetical protein HY044_00390 [Candidatus Woesebacteria bacterium]